jgi:hypothetical protein
LTTLGHEYVIHETEREVQNDKHELDDPQLLHFVVEFVDFLLICLAASTASKATATDDDDPQKSCSPCGTFLISA